MNEPWYENIVMSVAEAREHIFKALKYRCPDHNKLNQYIHKIIPDDTVMGSIRGYWTFQHTILKNAVESKLDHYEGQTNSKLKAFKALKAFKDIKLLKAFKK